MKQIPSNCIDCDEHSIIPDPDPDDWFCDDDVAVVCKQASNPDLGKKSKYQADHNEFRTVTVSCRPQKVRAESVRPKWCPKY